MTELTTALKALSDETRYTLVTLLLKHDYCVRALARQLDISEPAVSQHLKLLRSAGLVKGEKRGYFTHYSVNREILKDLGNKIIVLADTVPTGNGCQKNKPKANLFPERMVSFEDHRN